MGRARVLCAVAVLGSCTVTAAAAADRLIFDNFDASTHTLAFRLSGGDNPIALVNVSQTTTIDAIAVLNSFSAAGHLKFVIFDDPNTAPAFVSAPKAFAADVGVSTYKKSDPFSFTLLAGHSYDIGAIADVGGLWDIDQTGNTQNGLSTNSVNGTVNNFTTPQLILPHSAADIDIQLFAPAADAPLPGVAWAGVALMGGWGAVQSMRRKIAAG